MTAFDRAIAFTLRQEGGYVNLPQDPGGETNFGISKRAHPTIDIKNLTREQAVEIYKNEYWLPAGCENLPGSVAIAHFDCAVHSGISRATKILQAVLSAEEDGILGDATLAALHLFIAGRGAKMVTRQLVEKRMRFLIGLERSKMRWAFIEGFMARCFDLLARVNEDPLTPESSPP